MTYTGWMRAATIIIVILGAGALWTSGSENRDAPDAQAGAGPLRHVERAVLSTRGGREWGTYSRTDIGWMTAAHVSENATGAIIGEHRLAIKVLPDEDVAFLTGADWRADPSDVPELRPGDAVTVVGYPAADRDGETLAARVYTRDVYKGEGWPGWWIELIEGEGVVGGFSGGAVIKDDRVAAIITHSSFTPIEGTTGVWAKAMDLRSALAAAAGETPPLSLATETGLRPAAKRLEVRR